ncbi:PD-(D/E)XK nuclease family protein [uncultured Treponema sp.]|uniref:PD-(D/E)XK nuclease family protein n=1 Tax=uncultured Treponema sp. TaxID=162155 RepID=UPI0015C09283|nr:PD-(D/E)XK nuclease family protein [uncultured Treponema sp.]
MAEYLNNLVEQVLKENIKNQNVIFVFPTEIAAAMWADRAIFVTDCKAVALERFLAWDKFKGQAVRSENQDKTSVPSVMRQIFVARLIEENAENPFFKSLIAREYSKTAEGFAGWIASILPKLAMWKDYFEKKSLKNGEKDDEDEDLLVLYEKYSEFLNKYNFFDPAWEKPPFKNNGNRYFIFFPEINSDWEEYKNILESAKDFISIVNVPDLSESAGVADVSGDGAGEVPEGVEVKFFSNARVEIKNLANRLFELHHRENLAWDSMAVSVPDMVHYGAYIDSELDLMEIPHVTRFSRVLSGTPAGNFFNQLKDCISSKNSYESVKNLLLNDSLPWKDLETAKKLIAFGQENHCICSYVYNGENFDVWEKSFEDVKHRDFEVENFYKTLKNCLRKFSLAKSFDAIRTAYFEFRTRFFDMEKCSVTADKILGRCVSELGGLIDLEKQYDCSLPSPFNFFVEQLGSKKYLEQAENSGVQIYEYKTAACAPFDAHLIVDSSQASLNVSYRDFSFLNENKRKKLLNRDELNVSEKFIWLYRLNSLKQTAYFTCAERTLDAYAQPVSCLKVNDLRRESDENVLFGQNPYNSEKRWFCGGENAEFPAKITEIQSESFNNWLKFQKTDFETGGMAGIAGGAQRAEKAASAVAELNFKPSDSSGGRENSIYVSKSLLSRFFDCPRKWLFSCREMDLREQDNAAVLLDRYSAGNLYHKILELYLNELKAQNLVLQIEGGVLEPQLEPQYEEILEKSIDEAINFDGSGSEKNCFLKKELLRTTRPAIEKTIFNFVKKFTAVFNNCMVENCEESLKIQDDELNFTFNGRTDCLLKDCENGQFYLVDFKNSDYAVPKNLYLEEPEGGEESEGENSGENAVEKTDLPLEEQNLPDFQMPSYTWLLEKQENICIQNGAFFSINEANVFPVFGDEMQRRACLKKEIPDCDQFKKTTEKVIECVKEYVRRINLGDFRPNDKVQDYKRCSGCEYNSICRRTFNVAKKD